MLRARPLAQCALFHENSLEALVPADRLLRSVGSELMIRTLVSFG